MENFKGLTNKNILRIAGLVAAICILAGGCSLLRKEITKRRYKSLDNLSLASSYTIRHHYTLGPERIQEMTFDGPLTIENVDMFYQQGLRETAACVAKQLKSIVLLIENRLKIKVAFKLKVYLIRCDYVPQNITVQFDKESDSFSFPFFVAYDDENCETILSENPFYPYVFAHELVEGTITSPRQEFPVLSDFYSSNSFIKIVNYTRWFRDGLACYAEYMLHEELSLNQGLIESRYFLLHRDMIPLHPLSSLYEVKNNLFLWSQFATDKNDKTYYNASLGLFLLIEDKFGKDSISQILNNLNKSDYLDGKALIRIINETLRTDIRRIIRDFYWPDIGLNTMYLTPAFVKNRALSVMEGLFLKSVRKDSLADKAGFQQGDVIIDVDGQPIESNLEFEVALLRSIQKKECRITVDRLGMQETLVLKLD